MSNSPDLNSLAAAEPFDVCIIGSGFTGTILGARLAEKGVRTLILESGKNLADWFLNSRIKKLADNRSTGDCEYPTVRTKARAIGGNSNFWTGRCERFHPSDFSANPYTPEGNPWPFTYEEIEPYYERAERTLRVRGGELSELAPPRSNPLPLPARLSIESLKKLAASLGTKLDNSPTATPENSLKTFRVSKEILPRFLEASNGYLVTETTVTRLVPDSDGNIVGAEVRTMDGGKKEVKAKIFVVACGGIESPRLLLLSRSEQFPNGIGNGHDRVGRCFNEHPGVNFYGRVKHRLDTLYPCYRLGRTHQYYDDFRSDGLGSVLPVFIQSWAFPNHLMTPKVWEIPGQLLNTLSRLIVPEFYIGATIEMLPVDSNRVMLDESLVDECGNPLAHLDLNFSQQDLQTLDRTRTLIRGIFEKMGAKNLREGEVTWSRHHIGTCMMGEDPRTSVVDPQLRVHECSNLFVCGAETFVPGAASPPVLTITALTHRLADHLIESLEKGEVSRQQQGIRVD